MCVCGGGVLAWISRKESLQMEAFQRNRELHPFIGKKCVSASKLSNLVFLSKELFQMICESRNHSRGYTQGS